MFTFSSSTSPRLSEYTFKKSIISAADDCSLLFLLCLLLERFENCIPYLYPHYHDRSHLHLYLYSKNCQMFHMSRRALHLNYLQNTPPFLCGVSMSFFLFQFLHYYLQFLFVLFPFFLFAKALVNSNI